MSQRPVERRFKIINIHDQMILNLFCTKYSSTDCIPKMTFPDLPEDVAIMSCQWSFQKMCFEAVVYHPSFDIVSDFEIPPTLMSKIEVVRLKVESTGTVGYNHPVINRYYVGTAETDDDSRKTIQFTNDECEQLMQGNLKTWRDKPSML